MEVKFQFFFFFFGKVLFIILEGYSDDFLVLFQSLQANTERVTWSGHESFLPNPVPLIFHQLS